MDQITKQKGQTLIETIAAIFILTMALTAGLALTIYVLSHSDVTLNEITATNLAREGVDVIKNMRDTNWLESDAKAVPPWDLSDCYIGDPATPSNHFSCYPRVWHGVSGSGFHEYNLSADGAYRLEYNNTANTWTLASSPINYNLYLQSDGSYTHNPNGSSVFARRIYISRDTASPFADDSTFDRSELVVTSTVGWTGRGCSAMTGTPPNPLTTNCSVSVTERLTNWKDYR